MRFFSDGPQNKFLKRGKKKETGELAKCLEFAKAFLQEMKEWGKLEADRKKIGQTSYAQFLEAANGIHRQLEKAENLVAKEIGVATGFDMVVDLLEEDLAAQNLKLTRTLE